MMSAIYNTLREFEGTEIMTDIGKWRLMMVSSNPLTAAWKLMPSEKNLKLYEHGDPLIFATTEFIIKEQDVELKYRVIVGAKTRSNTSSFSIIHNGDPESVTAYLTESYIQIVDDFLQFTVEDLKKWGNLWVTPRNLPKPNLDITLDDSKDEAFNAPAEPVHLPELTFEEVLGTNDEDTIIKHLRNKQLDTDQKIDLYQKAKELRSNKLMNFVKGLHTESFKEFYDRQ